MFQSGIYDYLQYKMKHYAMYYCSELPAFFIFGNYQGSSEDIINPGEY
jgi:hypothetical protein